MLIVLVIYVLGGLPGPHARTDISGRAANLTSRHPSKGIRVDSR